MALTLPEAAKLSTDTLQRGVIEVFARNSAVLEMLPFMDIAGNSYKYNQEGVLPGIGFRDVNEGYQESAGIVNQLSEGLIIAGGDVDVDRFIVQTRGNVNDQRAIQTQMKTKALSLAWTKTFFKGDVAKEPKGFDGLEKRLTGKQVIDGKGGELTITMLDELIDAVEGEPDVIYLSKAMRRELKRVIQSHNGYDEGSYDAYGRKVMTYGGIPIRVIETDANGNEILGFDETGGTASLYAIKFGPEQYVSGLQNGTISVRDLGELNEKPVFRTRIEWYNGLAVFHPRAAARLSGVIKKDGGKAAPAPSSEAKAAKASK
ncbi:major capsid protein [Paenibacillus larvae]|uniref:major capsid protein n=1 Tax=Paenibacillus larvae TaxID=1464 RepID=UPI00016945FE|nr:phage major capsid protein [Paenibacillus larvae]